METRQSSPTHQAAQDIFFGQIVIVLARWFFISAMATLTLYATKSAEEMSGATLLVILLMVVNFFIHARYVMERPANPRLLKLAGLIDLLIITVLVIGWPGQPSGQPSRTAYFPSVGLHSQLFVLYYPMIFSFALVFTPKDTLRYTLTALGLYLAVCLITPLFFWGYEETLNSANLLYSFKLMLPRVVSLAAMGGLGTFYWRIQRQRQTQATALHAAR